MHSTIGALAMTLNRKGRKRKSGRRTASGRIVRVTVDHRKAVGCQPHRNWLPEALRAHERAESTLGCLSLLKRISESDFEAGRRFAVIVGAYRAVIGVPKGTVGSGRGYACEPSACRLEPQNCLCEVRTAKYRDATHILNLEGQRIYNTTYAVVVHDMIPDFDQLADLRVGLGALARGFGLTTRGKS